MSAPDAAAVEAAVRAEDAAAVRELLADATEADRRALAKALKPLLEGPKWELPAPAILTNLEDGMAFTRGQMTASIRFQAPEPSPDERARQDWHELCQTPAFAVLAVGVAGGLAAADRALSGYHGRDYRVSGTEWAVIAGVLADRNPPWLAELADARLRSRWDWGSRYWPLARRMVRLGAIDPPAGPEYGAMMVRSLAQEPPVSPPVEPGQSRYEPRGYRGPRRTMTGTGGDLLARAILNDPGLLEHEIWRLFTDPGVGQAMEDRRQITSWDQLVTGDQWTDALLELAEQGHLDRDRLLDESLDAFLRDFPLNHVGWYAGFHDRLAPSDDEAAARSARYLALLAAPSKVGVSLGQTMCGELLDAGRLDPAAFLAASGPALLFPQKSVATAQLKLIGKLAPARPDVKDSALAAAAQAFAHQREDVQAAALKLIAKHGVPREASARAAVAGLASALSPVLRPDAQALGLVPASQAPAPQDTAAAAAPAASLPAAQRITGVAEPAELVLLLAHLMEDASDALAVERALAGAVRLAALPLAERAEFARPLRKRARKQAPGDFSGPFSGQSIRADMSWLALTWGTGELPPANTMEHQGWYCAGHNTPWQARRPEIISGILSARVGEACTLIAAGRAPQLLAEPEFADGTVSPAELSARQEKWAAAGLTPCRYDLEVARLRAAQGTDEELGLEQFTTLPEVAFLTTSWYRQRRAGEVRTRPQKIPESARAPHCWPLLTNLLHSLDDRQYAVHHSGVRPEEMIAAWHLICPHDPELIAAHLLFPLSDGLEPGRNAAVTAVRGLASPHGTFGRICHLALVTGLSGASAEVRIAAADAWTQVAGQGRLDPALAAAAIELGVTGKTLKLSRIADGLGHVALDPVTAVGVAQVCLTAAAALLPAKPPGLHLLLELAALAGTLSPLPELPAPVAALARSGERTKLAEAARRLTR